MTFYRLLLVCNYFENYNRQKLLNRKYLEKQDPQKKNQHDQNCQQTTNSYCP